jgi:hypothetical protein
MLTEGGAGPALADFEASIDHLDRLASPHRAYHFPSATSLRIAMPKAWSATSFLSLVFSFRSSLSRLTVSILAPVYSLANSSSARLNFLMTSSGVCHFLFMRM